jgi:putative endonuclease
MNRRRGQAGEDAAADYLLSEGYELLARNYRCEAGEIDIIAKKDGCVVFAEVKARSSDRFGRPAEAVDFRKQERIRRTALYYLSEKGWMDSASLSFDVVEVYLAREVAVRHIKNAF